ncbi:hypothetical protein [Bradyrhizobium liaoningense]
MSNELEPIIRKIEKRSMARPGRVVVPIDQKTGKALSEAGMFERAQWVLKDVIFYEINVKESFDVNNARAAIAVFLTNERSDIEFRIRVRARPESAAGIAEALHDRELTPSEVLFKTIKNHLGALLEQSAKEGPASDIERISSNKRQWQAEIERVIAAKLKLDVDIIFVIPQPIIDTDVPIRVTAVPVTPNDAQHTEFPITVSVILARAQARAEDALPRADEERKRLIRDVVTKAFRDRLSLYQYWFRPGDVRNELAKALVEILARYAYSLKSLTIDPVEPPVSSEEQISDDVSWTGRLGRPIPFHIETRVRLLPTGAGIYHARKLPNRKEWIKAEVHAALQSAMHGRDFIDLTATAESEVHNTVHRRLNEQALSIGHDVDTFVASAGIPEKMWLKPVTIGIERREYKTKNDLVPAEFEIDLVVELPSLAPLEHLIQADKQKRVNDARDGANMSIRAAVVESATRAAARAMSQIEPSDYFSKYERWEMPVDDVPETGQQNYVRNQLVRAIRAELKTDFGINYCKVNPRRVDSRVAAIIRFLQSIGDINIDVDAVPSDSEGPHEVPKIKFVYFIGSVAPDQWATVIQRGEKPIPVDQLKTNLLDWSRAALRDRSTRELYGLASLQSSNLIVRKQVEDYVAQQASYHFGVVIGIKSINFERTKQDEVDGQINALPTLEREAQLKNLQRAIERFGNESDDETRIKYLRSRQEVLRGLIEKNPREEAEDFARLGRHETELNKIDGELQSTRRGHAKESILALGRPEKPAESEPAAPGSEEVKQPRDTSL